MGAPGVPGLNIGLDDQEVDQLISIVDSDRDGCISLKEFIRALTKSDAQGSDLMTDARNRTMKLLAAKVLPPPREEIEEIQRDAIELKELGGLTDKVSHKPSPDELVEQTLNNLRIRHRARGGLRKAFSVYDKDHSGSIDKSEFYGALKGLGINLKPQEFELFFQKFDKNGDGRVATNEFCDVVFRDQISQATSFVKVGLARYTAKGRMNKIDSARRNTTAPSITTSQMTKQPLSSEILLSDSIQKAPDMPVFASAAEASFFSSQLQRAKSAGALMQTRTMEWSQRLHTANRKERHARKQDKEAQIFLASRQNKSISSRRRSPEVILSHIKTHRNRPSRRQHSPVMGLDTTKRSFQYGFPEGQRFRTTKSSPLGHEVRMQQTSKRHRSVAKYVKGRELQQTQEKYRETYKRLQAAQNRSRIRLGAKSQMKYLDSMMHKELRGPNRRPGKHLTHPSLFPGTMTLNNPPPHPW